MASAISSAAAPLQPGLKAPVSITSSQPAPSRKPSPHNASNNRYSQEQIAEAVSDKATIALIRRVLCNATADKSATISELLPPLTSSNEVDLQVYGLVSVIMREFVYAWYSKITPDQVFVEEIVRVIAHVTRGLEQRIRKVDIEALLFDEVPELLDAHIRAYRMANESLHPPPYAADPRIIYHSLWPNPAISPVPIDEPTSKAQQENEAAYTDLLVQGVLAILLPTEDLENSCLTSLVGGILSDMIIQKGVGGKASQPWLIWEGITKITEIVKEKTTKSEGSVGEQPPDSHGNLSSQNANHPKQKWSVQRVFWLVLQNAFLAYTTVRFLVLAISSASSLPTRMRSSKRPFSSTAGPGHLQPPPSSHSAKSFGSQTSISNQEAKMAMISMKIGPCVANLFDLNTRMPWFCAIISFLQWCCLWGPGKVGDTDGVIDKLIHSHLTLRILNPAILPTALRSIRAALFPNNMPGPPRIIPTAEETVVIKRKCAESVLDIIPGPVRKVYFGRREGETESELAQRQIDEMEEVLDVFSDSYLNAHLLYAVVDLIVVRLFPEMAEKRVVQLRAERLDPFT